MKKHMERTQLHNINSKMSLSPVIAEFSEKVLYLLKLIKLSNNKTQFRLLLRPKVSKGKKRAN